MVFDYIDGGADDEHAIKNNHAAFSDYDILHKVLVGVDDVSTETTILGQKISMPVLTAPVAGNRLFHKDGEIAVARAAAKHGTIYSLSTLSSFSIEDVARATEGPKWFQLYVWKDRGLVREMMQRARAAGYSVLILTVDFPVTGNRERDPRNGFTIPPKTGIKQAWEAIKSPFWTFDYLSSPAIRYANLSQDTPAVSLSEFVANQLNAGFDWSDAEWLLGEWSGKSIIKGVVRSDDAKRAVKTGFDAITISNHGGRQLDSSPATIHVLPQIAGAVQGDAELIIDGGIRRGTDIIKALGLGAHAVSVGKAYLYGLAAAGENGVDFALSHLTESLRRDMALAGAKSIGSIDKSMVVARQLHHNR